MSSGMFTTKGRYALRVMADLAVHDGWVSLGEVSKRQGISRKYLEQVASSLLKAGYIEGRRGKGGGYRLTRSPEEYTLGEILRAAEEGTLAPVSCLDCSTGELCPRADECAHYARMRDSSVPLRAHILMGTSLRYFGARPSDRYVSLTKHAHISLVLG